MYYLFCLFFFFVMVAQTEITVLKFLISIAAKYYFIIFIFDDENVFSKIKTIFPKERLSRHILQASIKINYHHSQLFFSKYDLYLKPRMPYIYRNNYNVLHIVWKQKIFSIFLVHSQLRFPLKKKKKNINSCRGSVTLMAAERPNINILFYVKKKCIVHGSFLQHNGRYRDVARE